MPLTKAPYWTDLYYRVVAHYFWRPQEIGRISISSKSNRRKAPKNWHYWKDKLQSQEAPLNHIINFLFHVAPQELVDRVISALLKRQIDNLQLVAPTDGTIDYNVVQPDIIVSNSKALVFVEMKVDSKSSIDQFTKYAIAAHCIMQDEPQLKSADFIVLSRHADHRRVWKRWRRFEITDEEAVRAAALRGLEHDPTIWKEKGVSSYLRSNPDAVSCVCQQVRSIGLHLADYEVFAEALRQYAAKEKTLKHLIDGVLYEFSRRDLVRK